MIKTTGLKSKFPMEGTTLLMGFSKGLTSLSNFSRTGFSSGRKYVLIA
jgi:hypothetical protein